MALHWLKRIFSSERKDSCLVSIISEANTNTQDQLAEQKKGLRRLSLAQKQQGEAVERLVQQVSSLKFSLDQCQGIAFDYEQIVHLLDMLGKIHTASQGSSSVVSLVNQTTDSILQHANLEEVAHRGTDYPEDDCEVLGAFPHEQRPPGTVHDIIQQGYRTLDGDLVRSAKVVVYRKLDTEEISHELS